MRVRAVPVALGLVLVGCQQPAEIVVPGGAAFERDGLHVSGTATVRATPTLVVIHLGCTTTNAKPTVAKQETDRLVRQVLAALRGLGLAAGDVQTRQFSLNRSTDNRGAPTGWVCTNMLEIRIKDVDRAGAVLEAALAAGANRVDRIDYTIEELQTLRAQARDEACEVAQAKAEQYARNFKVRLGRPVRITEQTPPGWSFGRNVMTQSISYEDPSGAAGEPDTTLSAGSVAVNLTVSVTYAME